MKHIKKFNEEIGNPWHPNPPPADQHREELYAPARTFTEGEVIDAIMLASNRFKTTPACRTLVDNILSNLDIKL